MAKSQPIKLGIFDIDGTILRSSFLAEINYELIRQGIFPPAAQREIQKDHNAWLNRQGGYGHYIDTATKVHLKYIKHTRVTAVDRAVRNVLNVQRDRVYRFTRELIKDLKRQGYHLVAISGSPLWIVNHFAREKGFDQVFGSIFEIKHRRYTGVVDRTTYINKAAVLKRYVEAEHLSVDWKRSVAVGDTDGDLPILKLVGRPIAFNPNRTFAAKARRLDIPIVVERKDVIYHLKDFSFRNID